MLTGESEILKRLYELPEEFKAYARAKQYAAAKNCYDAAVKLCVCLNVDVEHKIKLFGNRPYTDDEKITDGLFPEKMVEYVYLQCIKERRTFENAKSPGKPR